MVVGAQQLGRGGVLDDLADLVPEVLAQELVGFEVGEHVLEGAHDLGEAAVRPAPVELGVGLLLGDLFERQLGRQEHEPGLTRPRDLAPLLQRLLALRDHGRIGDGLTGGQAEVGGALEHHQLACQLGHLRDHLDARRSGADHGDPLAVEVGAVGRPRRGVEDLSGELLDAFERGDAGDRQRSGRGHQELRCDVIAGAGGDRPRGVIRLIRGTGDACAEADVATQVELVGDPVEIVLDLGLLGVTLAPRPVPVQLFGERVGVVEADDVAARTGVAVPVPRAADVVAGLDHEHAQAVRAQCVERIEAGEPGPDHDHVVVELI